SSRPPTCSGCRSCSSATASCAGGAARAAAPTSSSSGDLAMLQNKTSLALMAFVLLGVGAYFAMRAPEKGERKGAEARPAGVAAIKPDAVDELEVTYEKQTTTLKK